MPEAALARWTRWRPTLHYMAETEAHVYALAIAASVLLSFYPFLMVMVSFCHYTLHWRAAEQAIYLALNDSFAGEAGDFIVRNLQPWKIGRIHFVSMFLLLFTANGIFEPLEVALNRAWGVATNRSYLKNQVVSLGLIFLCGVLVLLSFMLTGLNSEWIGDALGTQSGVALWLNKLVFKLAAIPLSILTLFLVYWILPNCKIDPRRILPVAIRVGLALEALKYVHLLLAKAMEKKLDHEYGVFQHSVTILLLSFVSALIVLAGAEFAARQVKKVPPAD